MAAMDIADFNSGMPSFDGIIPDEEIWDIIAFIRSTWPERERQFQKNLNPTH